MSIALRKEAHLGAIAFEKRVLVEIRVNHASERAV